MRGLPYRIDKNGIKDFFSGIDLSDDIYIEERNEGRRTGSALVFFASQDDAQAAKKDFHKNEINGRYIELFDKDDEFMRKVCRM